MRRTFVIFINEPDTSTPPAPHTHRCCCSSPSWLMCICPSYTPSHLGSLIYPTSLFPFGARINLIRVYETVNREAERRGAERNGQVEDGRAKISTLQVLNIKRETQTRCLRDGHLFDGCKKEKCFCWMSCWCFGGRKKLFFSCITKERVDRKIHLQGRGWGGWTGRLLSKCFLDVSSCFLWCFLCNILASFSIMVVNYIWKLIFNCISTNFSARLWVIFGAF